MTAAHDEKLTLHIDIEIPAHADRVDTPIYRESRPKLIEREQGKCWVCGRTEKETGEPLQTHHHPIERSFAGMIDFHLVETDCKAGLWGPHAQAFDWDAFWKADPFNPYLFVDDMTVNGLLLCREHHIGENAGIHAMPAPMILAQRYGKSGYQFTDAEKIIHD